MMKYFLMFFICGLGLVSQAQTKKVPVKKTNTTVKKMSPPVVKYTLKTIEDSASYAFGMRVAKTFMDDMKEHLNSDAFLQGMKLVFDKKPTILKETATDSIIRVYFDRQKIKEAEVEINKGEKFLAENKTKPGVHVTASGLQYEIIKEGNGIKPTTIDTVVCHYRGTLIDGTQFDASYDRGEPLTLTPSQVIKGWTEGLQLMNVGSHFKFYIPYQLGYGLRGAGQAIPPGAALIFEVELLDVKKAK